jgi:hypothetical protein
MRPPDAPPPPDRDRRREADDVWAHGVESHGTHRPRRFSTTPSSAVLEFYARKGDLEARHVLGHDRDEIKFRRIATTATIVQIFAMLTGIELSRGEAQAFVVELERRGFELREVAHV